MTGWIWVIVIAFFVIRALVSMNKKASTQGAAAQRIRSTLRQLAQDGQRSASNSAWPISGSTPNIPPMREPNAGWAPQSPGSAGPSTSSPGWQERLGAELEAQISSLTQFAGPPDTFASPQDTGFDGPLPGATAPPAPAVVT